MLWISSEVVGGVYPGGSLKDAAAEEGGGEEENEEDAGLSQPLPSVKLARVETMTRKPRMYVMRLIFLILHHQMRLLSLHRQ